MFEVYEAILMGNYAKLNNKDSITLSAESIDEDALCAWNLTAVKSGSQVVLS